MANEKVLERKFAAAIMAAGGRSFKLPAVYVSGLPDRIALMPGGVAFFAEIKSTGKKPTPIQKSIHKKIRALGFDVYVIDTLDGLSETLKKYIR